MFDVIDTTDRSTANSYRMGRYSAMMMAAALNAQTEAGRYILLEVAR